MVKKLNIALLILGIFFAFNVYKLIGRIFKNGNIEDRLKDMEKQTLPLFKKVEASAKGETRPKSELKAIASKLWMILEPVRRTNSAEILSLLEGLNDDELRLVYVEFGIKEINQLQLGFNFEKITGDLIEHIKNDLLNINPFDWNGLNKVKERFKGTGLWS